jgi:hypothetical protein
MVRIAHDGPRVGDRQALAEDEVVGHGDELERSLEDPTEGGDVAVRCRAELAVVRLRGGEDDQLLDPTLEDAARVDAPAKARERTQDLRSQAHGLEHLDRRLPLLPQRPALVE